MILILNYDKYRENQIIPLRNYSGIKDYFKGAIEIAVVVDKKNSLLGTLTDGDIRRGFLKGLNINSSIKSIIFKPTVVRKNYLKKN